MEFITEMIHCATDFVSNNLGILFLLCRYGTNAMDNKLRNISYVG